MTRRRRHDLKQFNDFEMLITRAGDRPISTSKRRVMANPSYRLVPPPAGYFCYFLCFFRVSVRRRRHDFFYIISKCSYLEHVMPSEALNGCRWKAQTLSFPTIPWSTYFDLNMFSCGLFKVGVFCSIRRVDFKGRRIYSCVTIVPHFAIFMGRK